jgi:hypothetical protein
MCSIESSDGIQMEGNQSIDVLTLFLFGEADRNKEKKKTR